MPTDLHSCRATRDTAPAPRVERRGRRVLAGCGRAQLTGTRYGKGGANFDLLLKAFTGDHSPCHRIGKDIPLERPALSLVLCVQPAAIADVLRDHYAKDTRQPVRRQPCRTRRLTGVLSLLSGKCWQSGQGAGTGGSGDRISTAFNFPTARFGPHAISGASTNTPFHKRGPQGG